MSNVLDGSSYRTQFHSNSWILIRQLVHIAYLDIFWNDPRPLCAGAKEPQPTSKDPRGVERITRDQKLNALAASQVRPDNDALTSAICMQKENLEGIAQIIVIKLVIADAMEPHWRTPCHHEVESRS